jgi:hypothetical protein
MTPTIVGNPEQGGGCSTWTYLLVSDRLSSTESHAGSNPHKIRHRASEKVVVLSMVTIGKGTRCDLVLEAAKKGTTEGPTPCH